MGKEVQTNTCSTSLKESVVQVLVRTNRGARDEERGNRGCKQVYVRDVMMILQSFAATGVIPCTQNEWAQKASLYRANSKSKHLTDDL